MKKLITLLCFTLSFYFVLTGQKTVQIKDTSWIKISDATIDFQCLNDEIKLKNPAEYVLLKFTAYESPVTITNLEFFYNTGEKQVIKTDLLVSINGNSNAIELHSGERKLTRITFVYKALPGETQSKTVMQIWGAKKYP